MRRFVSIALAVMAMTLLFAAPVLAEERTCRGSIGAVTVDNLRVPQGATCTLSGTYIKGTLKVERDATLKASRVRVVGNVQAENHQAVIINSSTIGGSVQLKQGGSATRDRQPDHWRSPVRLEPPGHQREEQHHQWEPAGLLEPRRPDHHEQPDQREPAVQVECSGADRQRQHRPGQQGGSVQAALTEQSPFPAISARPRRALFICRYTPGLRADMSVF